jgi:hypothetical protein
MILYARPPPRRPFCESAIANKVMRNNSVEMHTQILLVAVNLNNRQNQTFNAL